MATIKFTHKYRDNAIALSADKVAVDWHVRHIILSEDQVEQLCKRFDCSQTSLFENVIGYYQELGGSTPLWLAYV